MGIFHMKLKEGTISPMQQPLYQPLPPPQPPRRSRRRFWLILSIAAGVIILSCVTCGIIGSMAPPPKIAAVPTPTTQPTQPLSQVSTPTTIPTKPPTVAPTTQISPTPKPTSSPSIHTSSGPAILGADISSFIAKYGQPDTGCASCASGTYNFQRYQGSQLDYLQVMLVDADTPHKGHVNTFLVQAPPHVDWDTQTATAICESFGPTDVNYDHPVKVISASDGSSIQKIYTSAWLAKQLTSSDFVDTNTNPVTLGTFSLFYSFDGSPSKVASCSVEAGIPQS